MATSFPGFSLSHSVGQVGEYPGNEVDVMVQDSKKHRQCLERDLSSNAHAKAAIST